MSGRTTGARSSLFVLRPVFMIFMSFLWGSLSLPLMEGKVLP